MTDSQISTEHSTAGSEEPTTTEDVDKIIQEVYADEEWAEHLRPKEVVEGEEVEEGEEKAEGEGEPETETEKKPEPEPEPEPEKKEDPAQAEARRRFLAAEKAERRLQAQRREFETRVSRLEAIEKQMQAQAEELARRERAIKEDPLGALRQLGITPEQVLAAHIRASGDTPSPELEARVREQTNSASTESKILAALDERLSGLNQTIEQRLAAITRAQEEQQAEAQRAAQARSMKTASAFVSEHSEDYPILASYDPEEVGEQMLEIGLQKRCSLEDAARYIEDELSQRLSPAIERYAAKRQQSTKTPRKGASSGKAPPRATPEVEATKADDGVSTSLSPEEVIEQRWAQVEADWRAGKVSK